MARKKKRNQPRQAEIASAFLPRLAWWIIAAFSFVIPLAVSPSGKDSFRLPKDLLFRAEGILILALVALEALWGRFSWREIPWRNPVFVLPVAILLWTAVATTFSTNREISIGSLGIVALEVAIFIATVLVLQGQDERALIPLLLAAAVNGGFYLLQDFGMWNPFGMTAEFSGHSASSGLLGNANDVGSALLAPALAAVALTLAARKWRWVYAPIALVLLAALIVSRSMTAIAALLAGLAVLAIVRWRLLAIIPLLLLALAMAGAVFAFAPLRERAETMRAYARQGDYDQFLSGRTSSFRAATHMFLDRPLLGQGPGTFGWQYMPYKLRLDEHRSLIMATSEAAHLNFEEAHNDHLEVLAETGALGYLLFLAAVAVLGAGSFNRRADQDVVSTARQNFAQIFALPLAAGFFVLALAQYPLQLASATSSLIFLTAACLAWRRVEDV